MAKWSLNRPEQHCNDGEIEVARHLQQLPDDWFIRWGFYYNDQQGVRREGDFLILAPYGGVLVLEVKGGKPRQFSPTGRFEGKKQDNPLVQLDKEWDAVVKSLKGTDAQPMYIAKALGLPAVVADLESDHCCNIPRDTIFAGNEMADLQLFGAAMMRFFKPGARGGNVRRVTDEQRDAFFEIYGGESDAVSVQHFIDHTEARFRLRLISEYRMLDMLQGNQQLLVEGGCGSGKSWYAMEQARRYAREGKSVLFLAYNRALTRTLRMDVAHEKGNGCLGAGKIVVKNFEELAAEVIGESVEVCLPDKTLTREELEQFYEIGLPRRVLQALRSFEVVEKLEKYDALVVDEGQDHDTVLHPEVAKMFPDAACGWWSIYWLLLKEQCNAPMAIFYDESQRPMFRRAGGFRIEMIRGHLSQPAYVKLLKSIRYTRPLYDYLMRFQGEGTCQLLEPLGDGRQLPEGPEVVEEEESDSPKGLQKQIVDLVKRWESDGLCVPEEVLLLHSRSELQKSAIGQTEVLGDYPLIGYQESGKGIRHCSIHKAKGLDSKAVILIGVVPCGDDTQSAYDRFTHFMGASRARQILGVIYKKKGDSES